MSELPPVSRETLTFLFTDIVGATRLWERHPEAMQDALARYDAAFRRAISDHAGHIFKTLGDAFCVAFPDAPDALAAAVAAQRALCAEEWGEIGALKVRMALNTGTAVRRDGDYFGSPLNLVARLTAAGHGGQILLSRATQELVHEHLPAGVALRDLGEYRLHDMLAPERVFQVVAPGLSAEFPPLRTLDRLEAANRVRVMGQEILSLLDRGAILARLMHELPALLPAASGTLFLLDPAEGVYRQAGGRPDAPVLSLAQSHLLLHLRQSRRPVSSAAETPAPAPLVELPPDEGEMSRSLGAVIWVPLLLHGRLFGALALGRKTSDERYTEEELEALCALANEAAAALEMAALSAQREQQARLQHEIAIARSIQSGLLPPARLGLEGYEILSRSEPSAEVGGDFVNLFPLPGRTGAARLGIVLGDVAGTGVPAALFMAVTTTLIQGQAQLLPSPAATLAAANAELYPKMRPPGGKQRLFATALYGVLDTVRREIRIANAGQTPPIYWPANGEPRYLRLPGLPLGALPGAHYEEQVLRLLPGDRLLFCSDGFIEAWDPAGVPIGYAGFLRRLMPLRALGGHELFEKLFERGGEPAASPDFTAGGIPDDPGDHDDRTLVLLTAPGE